MRLALGIALASIASAQDFSALAKACAPEADLKSIAAIVHTESGFRPYALSLNYPTSIAGKHGLPPGRMWLATQPQTREQAVRWAQTLLADGYTLSIGLMQVSTNEGYPLEQLVDPCSNLRIGWSIFVGKYQQAVARYGPGQRAVQAAISLYNSGSMTAGFKNGYVGKVVGNAR